MHSGEFCVIFSHHAKNFFGTSFTNIGSFKLKLENERNSQKVFSHFSNKFSYN